MLQHTRQKLDVTPGQDEKLLSTHGVLQAGSAAAEESWQARVGGGLLRARLLLWRRYHGPGCEIPAVPAPSPAPDKEAAAAVPGGSEASLHPFSHCTGAWRPTAPVQVQTA